MIEIKCLIKIFLIKSQIPTVFNYINSSLMNPFLNLIKYKLCLIYQFLLIYIILHQIPSHESDVPDNIFDINSF